MGTTRPQQRTRNPRKGAWPAVTFGAEDGIRTRDPHLGKVMSSIGLRPLVPLSRFFPVGFSADSAELARFRERWFNALNEPDFAESPRATVLAAGVDSPSSRVPWPTRTTENLESITTCAYICVEHIGGHIFVSSFATMPGGGASSCSASSQCEVTAGSRSALRPTANRSSTFDLCGALGGTINTKDVLFPMLQNS